MKSPSQDRNGWDTELGCTTSTQTLGVRSSSTISLHKKTRRQQFVLLVTLCLILTLSCTVLVIFLVLKDKNSDAGEKNCKTMQKGSVLKECTTEACLLVRAEVKKNLDESVDPCKNFFHYSCDGWINSNPIPASANRFSTLAHATSRISKPCTCFL